MKGYRDGLAGHGTLLIEMKSFPHRYLGTDVEMYASGHADGTGDRMAKIEEQKAWQQIKMAALGYAALGYDGAT